jgi:aspartate racemase
VKTIGVLGGIGPQATMDFEARVHAVAQRLIPPQANTGYPPMVVYYHRRPPVLVGPDGHSPIFPIQPDPVFLDALRRLGAWADFLVVTANGPHLFQAEIERVAGIPLLSMIDLTLAQARERGWRRIGVLGLGEPHVYLEPLGRQGIATEALEEGPRERLDAAILAVMEGRAGEPESAVMQEALTDLRGRGVDGIILGCTELPFLVGPAADTSPVLINPIQLLAEAAVRRAME